MPEQHIHIGDSSQLATGNMQIAADGDLLMLSANNTTGAVLVTGGKGVNLQCGPGSISVVGSEEKADITLQGNPLSTITIALGPAVLGPRFIMSEESIEIAMGPPGAGASIKMTPASIKLSIATTTYELTPMGHTMAVPANSYSLTPSGETASVLNSTVTAQIKASVQGTAMAEFAAAGQTTVKGAMVMIN